MSKITILSEIKRDKPFNEKLPKINSKEFDKVIKSRRSIRVFTNEVIPNDIIKKSLDNSLNSRDKGLIECLDFTTEISKVLKHN